jgi:hypothetical protein
MDKGDHMAKQGLSISYIKSVIRVGGFGAVLCQLVSKQYEFGEFWGMLNVQIVVSYWIILYLLERLFRAIVPCTWLGNPKIDVAITLISVLLMGVSLGLFNSWLEWKRL